MIRAISSTVTYHSDPPGATIAAGSQNFGRAPVTLSYQISQEQRKTGKMSLQGVTATWISGAQVSHSQINVDLKNSDNQQLTLKRPSGAAGLDKDMNYALELEKLNYMKRQAEASEAAAVSSAISANNRTNNNNSWWVESGGKTQMCNKIGAFVSCM